MRDRRLQEGVQFAKPGRAFSGVQRFGQIQRHRRAWRPSVDEGVLDSDRPQCRVAAGVGNQSEARDESLEFVGGYVAVQTLLCRCESQTPHIRRYV
jgi:hypothetical protein